MYYELWAGESRDYRIWGNGEVEMQFHGGESWYPYPGNHKEAAEIIRGLCISMGQYYADGSRR